MKLSLVKQLLTLLFIFTSFNLLAQDTLTKIDVNAGAKLANLTFSEKEIEMMLPDLKENILDFIRKRPRQDYAFLVVIANGKQKK